MKYPNLRLRRLRENNLVRSLVTERRLDASRIVYPVFFKEGITQPQAISSMPGQFQWPIQKGVEYIQSLHEKGLSSVILFGIPQTKDAHASKAHLSSGIIQKVIQQLKKKCPNLLVIADVCLCEYTDHGHCGVIHKGKIENDKTLKIVSKIAVSYADAGADIIAPSDMMDGRVRAIRSALDKNSFTMTPILSYAVKYASSFYAPFRVAAESQMSFGDRKSYQMNPANRKEAIREVQTDLEEGADMLLVKPALGYEDILFELKQKFSVPIGAYSVSGEYSMIKAAAQNGWIDEKNVVTETHLSMLRAGADFIMTYWAKEILSWQKK